MARKNILLLSVLFVVFLSGTGTAALEQEFEISKKLGGINQGPRLAVNTRTGDVLIVWSHWQLGNQIDISIHMALCKRKGNGSYKVSKARQVSPKNHTCSTVDVGYNPEDNSYLAVWSAYLNTGGAFGEDEVYSRKISATGRAKGSPRNISLSDDTRHLDKFPVIGYSPGSGKSTPAAKGGYLVVWYSRPNVSGEPRYGGLFGLLLDQDGKPIGDAPIQIKKLSKDEEGYTNRKLMRTDDGNYVLATLFRIQLDPYVEQPLLIKIRSNGTYSKETLLDKDYGFSFAAVKLSKKLLYSFWRTASFTGYRGVRANNLKALKKQPAAGILTLAYKNDLVKLGTDPGGYHIFSVTDSLYGHYIAPRGKPEGEPEFILQSNEYVYDVVAASIPGTNEVFVVFAKSNDIVKQEEIGGYVFDPLDRLLLR